MLSAIIVAAGGSRRMGFDKLFAPVGNKPVLTYSIAAFERAESVGEIVLVAREEQHEQLRKLIAAEKFKKVRSIVPGGERRQDSVRAGLQSINDQAQRHKSSKCLCCEELTRPFQKRIWS
jgi:2-C-methyl-D-erythritol 4-phosphate cytidylyltransferase